MAPNSKMMTFIALIIAFIAIPSSTAGTDEWTRSEEETAQYLKDLCSKTSRSDDCWKVLKPELKRFENSDDRVTVGAALDLAIAKSDEIHKKLNQLYTDSGNAELKEKYISCSKNYNDVNRDLEVARKDVDSDNKSNLGVQLKDAVEELNNCRSEFGETESYDFTGHVKEWLGLGKAKAVFDPAHIKERNKELGLYLEIASVAIELIK